MRVRFDPEKSAQLRANPKRAIGFEEALELFGQPYYLDQRCDDPEQYRAIGWVQGRLYTLIFEIRDDREGEYYRFVTLWKATEAERRLFQERA
jgi:uncharacterized DUF497 family protein